MSDMSHAEYRRRRVKRLKKMIVGGIFVLITIPLALCIWLVCELHSRENELAEITAQYEAQLQITEDLQLKLDEETAQAKEQYEELLSRISEEAAAPVVADTEPEAPEEPEDGIRRVYLTFDDGPSANTEQILEILDEYNVKATFFVTGEAAESNPELYREIVDRGHSIGMHSYTHKYSEVYKNKESFIRDYTKIRDFLTETVGVTPAIYRFPGGSSNTVSRTDMDELCEYIESQGVRYFDWNISSGDATRYPLTPEKITYNCLSSVGNFNTAVILLHDTGAKYTTVQALPAIIEGLQEMDDTQILPITDETKVIQHRKSKESE